MPKFIDLTGTRVGKLRVISRTESRGAGAFWNVACDCGTTKVLRADGLHLKRVKSCGCGIGESNRRRTKHGAAVNGRKDLLYSVWQGIKARCTNPDAEHYHRYGGRGVTMHPPWVEDYALFREYMGKRPAGATVDRIDNNGNYEPGNVRWATRKEQANNRVTNVVLEWEGQTMTLKQWAEHRGQKYGLLASRWKNGLRGAELFAAPAWERNALVTHNGEARPMTEWAKLSGVPYSTLRWRYVRGEPLF
jgi:hypothetical protein